MKPLHTLSWKSYWRRAPLQLQARLGDREAEGLDEAEAFLRGRHAAVFLGTRWQDGKCCGEERTESLQRSTAAAGTGFLRLQAHFDTDVPPCRHIAQDVVVMVGAEVDNAARQDFQAAAVGISRGCDSAMLLLEPGLALEPQLARWLSMHVEGA